MASVTKLRLVRTDTWQHHKASRDYLEEFMAPLVMPQLTRLELVEWVATSSLLVELPERSFPALRHLRLERVVLDHEGEGSDDGGGHGWVELGERLLAGDTALRTVGVEEPRQCVFNTIGADQTSFAPREVCAAAMEELRAVLRR
ncbi:hypothetical protein LTR08_005534 [Meristemomyces frigidus]|nr:hypothetical protein LTR08_005534 [Meristemomyces frigidus]